MNTPAGFRFYNTNPEGRNDETELRNVRSGATNFPGKNVMPTRDQRSGPATQDDSESDSDSGDSSSSGPATGASAGGVA